MQTAAEIWVFESPFDNNTEILRKITKIETAYSDYFLSSLWVDTLSEKTQDGSIFSLSLPTLWVSLGTRKDEVFTYNPIVEIVITVLPGKFEERLVGTLISDLTGLVRGVFHDDFFVDTASEYPLSKYAKGSPKSTEKLTGFDLSRPNSTKNRTTLSYLLHTRMGLERSINRMRELDWQPWVDNANTPAILSTSHAWNLDFADTRLATLDKPLQLQIKQIESLITHFISLL